MSEEPASFLAAFPAIQSAIKIYGDLQGMRLQFDVPESEMGEAIKLLMWRECILKVTIEPEAKPIWESGESDNNRAASRTAAKKRI